MQSCTIPNKAKNCFEKTRPAVVLIASVLSHIATYGLGYGILGTITIEQSKRFGVTLNGSSWTGSIHLAFEYMLGEYHFITTIIATTAVSLTQLMKHYYNGSNEIHN